MTAIKALTPEQSLAIQAENHNFQVHLQELGVKLDEIDAGDRSSARSMQIATRSWMPPTLGLVVTLGFFGTLGLMMFATVSGAQHDVLLIMVGALGAAFGQVISFNFGSSSDSHRKTELLGQQQQQ